MYMDVRQTTLFNLLVKRNNKKVVLQVFLIISYAPLVRQLAEIIFQGEISLSRQEASPEMVCWFLYVMIFRSGVRIKRQVELSNLYYYWPSVGGWLYVMVLEKTSVIYYGLNYEIINFIIYINPKPSL